MPLSGFELGILGRERPKIHALNLTATGTGENKILLCLNNEEAVFNLSLA